VRTGVFGALTSAVGLALVMNVPCLAAVMSVWSDAGARIMDDP
jgi:uncharacterized membrane protein